MMFIKANLFPPDELANKTRWEVEERNLRETNFKVCFVFATALSGESSRATHPSQI